MPTLLERYGVTQNDFAELRFLTYLLYLRIDFNDVAYLVEQITQVLRGMGIRPQETYAGDLVQFDGTRVSIEVISDNSIQTLSFECAEA